MEQIHSTFQNIIKILKTQNHYQTLSTKIVYALKFWYFKNMKKKAIDIYQKGKYELRMTGYFRNEQTRLFEP